MNQQAEDMLPLNAASDRRLIARALVKQVIEEIVDADYYNPLVPGLANCPPAQSTQSTLTEEA